MIKYRQLRNQGLQAELVRREVQSFFFFFLTFYCRFPRKILERVEKIERNRIILYIIRGSDHFPTEICITNMNSIDNRCSQSFFEAANL